MQIVHVFIHVKPEHVDAFIEATRDNAANSLREAGVARFDFLQQEDDPTRFVLVEVYTAPDAPDKHKETEHYKRWRDRVAEMMAEPRRGVRYTALYPPADAWEKQA
jgi:autoinducer 2-degrading protein